MKEEVAKIFIDGKNAMAVLNMNQLKGHTGSAFHGIFIAAGRTEAAVTAERNKFKLPTVRTSVHGTTERGIPTVDHLINIFHLSISGMKRIFNFFIIVDKDIL